MMHEYSWAAPGAFALLALGATAVFLVLIRPVIALMRALGWVDRPSSRKAHTGAIPLAGGTGIMATLVVVGVWVWLAPASLGIAPELLAPLREPWALGLAGGAMLVFAVAFVDDRHPIRARWRFITQAAAAFVAVVGGTVIGSLGSLLWAQELPLALWLGVPFTIFGMCGVINAVNMSDGLDGLAGGIALIAVAWFGLALALIARSQPEAASVLPLVVALAGALVGFLMLNLRTRWRARAAIFMGDGGSMTLGFVLAWLAVRTTGSYGAASMPPVVALWILAVPLIDTISSILRRILAGVTPMSPDHRHLHHLLPTIGLSIRQTVGTIHAAALALGGLGVLGWLLGVPDWLMFWSWIGIFLAYHLSALRFWSKQPEDPFAPPPEECRYLLRELAGRLHIGGGDRLQAVMPPTRSTVLPASVASSHEFDPTDGQAP